MVLKVEGALVICMVGLPGSGKTTVGLKLASIMGIAFRDSDQWIESHAAQSVQQIFEARGEDAFRDLETQALSTLIREDGVLSTGGGVVLREVNRKLLSTASAVVYLQAEPEHLMQRLRHDRRRPLLQGGDRLATLKKLYDERDPMYRAVATVEIPVACHGAAQIARTLGRILKEGLSARG